MRRTAMASLAPFTVGTTLLLATGVLILPSASRGETFAGFFSSAGGHQSSQHFGPRLEISISNVVLFDVSIDNGTAGTVLTIDDTDSNWNAIVAVMTNGVSDDQWHRRHFSDGSAGGGGGTTEFYRFGSPFIWPGTCGNPLAGEQDLISVANKIDSIHLVIMQASFSSDEGGTSTHYSVFVGINDPDGPSAYNEFRDERQGETGTIYLGNQAPDPATAPDFIFDEPYDPCAQVPALGRAQVPALGPAGLVGLVALLLAAARRWDPSGNRHNTTTRT